MTRIEHTDPTPRDDDAERIAKIISNHSGSYECLPEFCDVVFLMRIIDSRDAALREARAEIDRLRDLAGGAIDIYNKAEDELVRIRAAQPAPSARVAGYASLGEARTAREIAVEITDAAFGYTCEFNAHPAYHSELYDIAGERIEAALTTAREQGYAKIVAWLKKQYDDPAEYGLTMTECRVYWEIMDAIERGEHEVKK